MSQRSRKTPFTDFDCILRDGAACCEGCDGKGLVSLNKQQQALPPICDGNMGCPPCAPIIPPEFAPKCELGYCKVTRSILR